jgi:methionyl-tRNA synthetase
MLKAEGSYILPDNVPANEFLNLEGNKLSTSKNWAVWLHEYLVDFPGQQDVLRYALTSNARKLRIMILLGKIFKRETTMN